MQDQIWYVYQNQQQLGPFSLEQVQQMYSGGMVHHSEAFVYRAGWKDWRLVTDCLDELGVRPPEGAAPPNQNEQAHRRKGAPRASISGRVVVHNDGQLVIGSGVNISMTGIFVETTDRIFTVGERLKLSVKCEGVHKPFNVVASVIRYNSDSRMPVGYGLMFESIDPLIREEIKGLVALQNRGEELPRNQDDNQQVQDF